MHSHFQILLSGLWGPSFFVFYCIFMMQFVESFEGVQEVPPPFVHLCFECTRKWNSFLNDSFCITANIILICKMFMLIFNNNIVIILNEIGFAINWENIYLSIGLWPSFRDQESFFRWCPSCCCPCSTRRRRGRQRPERVSPNSTRCWRCPTILKVFKMINCF